MLCPTVRIRTFLPMHCRGSNRTTRVNTSPPPPSLELASDPKNLLHRDQSPTIPTRGHSRGAQPAVRQPMSDAAVAAAAGLLLTLGCPFCILGRAAAALQGVACRVPLVEIAVQWVSERGCAGVCLIMQNLPSSADDATQDLSVMMQLRTCWRASTLRSSPVAPTGARPAAWLTRPGHLLISAPHIPQASCLSYSFASRALSSPQILTALRCD